MGAGRCSQCGQVHFTDAAGASHQGLHSIRQYTLHDACARAVVAAVWFVFVRHAVSCVDYNKQVGLHLGKATSRYTSQLKVVAPQHPMVLRAAAGEEAFDRAAAAVA